MARPDRVTDHLYADHARQWRSFTYVYPVLSRRSGGLSIGVNLNVDKLCNFDCVYCQVDRTDNPTRQPVDTDRVIRELRSMCESVISGAIWADPRFADTPAALRRLNDIALSGDGEPTLCRQFPQAVQGICRARAELVPDEVDLILLTNATQLHRPEVVAALDRFHEAGGQIWAKLDAGTSDYYRQVDRSAVAFDRVLENLAMAGRRWRLVIQTLWVRLHGRGPDQAQINAYLDRLADLIDAGATIRMVQIHTVARKPAEPYVQPLPEAELRRIAEQLNRRLPDLPCSVYPGCEVAE
jgi:wyosine [tRNA(Phe)-imidazoG37] synthetase (radical SAM superfamily)